MRNALASYLKDLVTFAYKTGWRLSEISGLTWSQVDRDQGIVCLQVGETKNEEARSVYLDSELQDIFERQWEKRRKAKAILPYVFVNRIRNDRIKRFDKAWKKACKEAKIGIRLFHDFRRTAVGNMIRSGILDRVAMMISGHKTHSVFDPYNIVSDSDSKLAAQKQAEYLDSQMVTFLGTIHQIDGKKAVGCEA